MAILLLGECLPYRNSVVDSFDNSQGRMIASSCGLSVHQLMQLCDCMYLIPKYVPSYRKKKQSYEDALELRFARLWQTSDKNYHVIICIGKRLMNVLFSNKDFFINEQFAHMQVACIPSPAAEYWWKESVNVVKVGAFLNEVFTNYATS